MPDIKIKGIFIFYLVKGQTQGHGCNPWFIMWNIMRFGTYFCSFAKIVTKR
jgi:hypothetical protein